MKKFFFTAALSFVAVLCISATVVESNHTESHPSAVIASIDGIDDEIEFETVTLAKVYNLMPQKVKSLCVSSYEDISSRIEKSSKSFTYAGVKISPVKSNGQTTLKFSYGGHSVVVKNYNKAEFDAIFGM